MTIKIQLILIDYYLGSFSTIGLKMNGMLWPANNSWNVHLLVQDSKHYKNLKTLNNLHTLSDILNAIKFKVK